MGSRSTGSASDFQHAATLVKQLIASGMSELGLVSADDVPEEVLHQEISRILAEQEKKIFWLLEKRRAVFERLVTAVWEKERLAGEEMRDILEKNHFYCNLSA